MNQKIDELIFDISVKFFPEDADKREELENVLDALVTQSMIDFRKELGEQQYIPDEVKHG